MPFQRDKRIQRAHDALLDWGNYWVMWQVSSHYQQCSLVDMIKMHTRIQTPTESKLPHVDFTKHTVLAVNNWYESHNSCYKTWACSEYILPKNHKDKIRLSRYQKEQLLRSVAEWINP